MQRLIFAYHFEKEEAIFHAWALDLIDSSNKNIKTKKYSDILGLQWTLQLSVLG